MLIVLGKKIGHKRRGDPHVERNEHERRGESVKYANSRHASDTLLERRSRLQAASILGSRILTDLGYPNKYSTFKGCLPHQGRLCGPFLPGFQGSFAIGTCHGGGPHRERCLRRIAIQISNGIWRIESQEGSGLYNLHRARR